MTAIKIIDGFLDILYPRRCPVCDDIVLPKGAMVCNKCADAFTTIKGGFCLKCGKPLKDEGRAKCDDCLMKNHQFDTCRSAFIYDEAMRKCIYRFKYHKRSEYAKYLGQRMADELKDYIKSCNADAIIPVPMYRKKERKRGYNQAYLLAKELGKVCGIPIRNDIVIRNRNTKIMRSLGAAMRENNLKRAFKIVGDSVKLTNVILVDDIYTTGSTADAVAGVLKAAGVRRVFVTSLSTGNNNN